MKKTTVPWNFSQLRCKPGRRHGGAYDSDKRGKYCPQIRGGNNRRNFHVQFYASLPLGATILDLLLHISLLLKQDQPHRSHF